MNLCVSIDGRFFNEFWDGAIANFVRRYGIKFVVIENQRFRNTIIHIVKIVVYAVFNSQNVGPIELNGASITPVIEAASIKVRCADFDCKVITSFLRRNAGVALHFAPPQGS